MLVKKNWGILRMFAMLSVILIHTTCKYITTSTDHLNWWALLLNQISRFAVPAFFITSGFGLVISKKYDEPYKQFIKKDL